MAGEAVWAPKRVLIFGRRQDVFAQIKSDLEARGISVQGTVDLDSATADFDANDFDLISFGGGLYGEVADRMKAVFARQNPAVRFLDAFGPVAVPQIMGALADAPREPRFLAEAHVVDDAAGFLLRGSVRERCTLVVRIFPATVTAPISAPELVAERMVDPGPFEVGVEDRFRTDALMLVVTVREDPDAFFTHRMTPPAATTLSPASFVSS